MEIDNNHAAFPLEIFQEIIDQVGPDNKEVLIPIGLVSASFAQMRRPHLFHQIKIDLAAEATYHKRLMDLIREYPSLPSHVRHITYDRPSPRALPNMQFRLTDQRVDETPSRPLYLEFPNISALSITSHSPVSLNVDRVIPALMRHFLSTEHLTQLHLHRLEAVPFIELLAQPNLHHLELSGCRLGPWHLDLPDCDIQHLGLRLKTFTGLIFTDHSLPLGLLYCQQLEKLVVDCHSDPLFAVAGPVDISQLLVHQRPPPAFLGVTSIVCSASTDWASFCIPAEKHGVKAFPSVTTLEIRQETSAQLNNMFDLLFDHMTRLERLCIQNSTAQGPANPDPPFFWFSFRTCFNNFRSSLKEIYIHWKMQHYYTSMIWDFYRAFEDARKTNVLESFVLNLQITTPRTSPLLADDDLECWRRLDQVLMQDRISDFPHLCYVEICICVPLKEIHSKNVNFKQRGRHVTFTGRSRSQYAHILDEPLARLRAAKDIDVLCAVYAW